MTEAELEEIRARINMPFSPSCSALDARRLLAELERVRAQLTKDN